MFQMHRIFCATPWELEAERYRFYETIGRFNETAAMQKGVLYVPVTMTNVMDKRPLQYTVDQNIRECRHYILLLTQDWGPAERNFQSEYQLALEAIDDPALPMQSAAVFAKKQPSGQPLAAGLPEPRATFSTPAEFDDCILGVLSGWLESLLAQQQNEASFATSNAG
jgi:hypothetical protein